ncbi:hypothetical protein [Fodinicola feengrottensis]|uniref:Uncharacterized protein n=1 Tax=Fodinicola feengrottensis TaxID=435914 RepID=A0ABN2IFN3_9ACTN|nr:hypothetical protein [Fodinicola feengrottensis]
MPANPESQPDETPQDATAPEEPMNRAARRAQKKGKQITHTQVPGNIQARGSKNTGGVPRQWSSRRAG